MGYLGWIITAILSLVFVYLVFRFASAAYYRSKKEFLEWSRKNKGDNTNE